MAAAFYHERAITHGLMASHYIDQAITGLTRNGEKLSEFSIDWAIDHAAIHAREAWHYALLMTPGQVASAT